ncbi:MAG TPA: hypothetical protein VN969_18515 [Streptosporangiaceae bacterium]|nr:hypothetical protein [Streptosporangiaceae bacterium]
MGVRDFDFLHGSWQISHRYLKERLTGCEEWEEFSSEITCTPILGGAGNIDHGEIRGRGYFGATVRLYDPPSDTWSLYWMTSLSGAMEPPTVGRFADGVGEFTCPDAHNGIPVICRYLWTDIKPDSVQWAQALSPDDGKTWETNWYMHLSRIS